MKTGDKVYCIKDRIDSDDHGVIYNIFTLKNKFYTILSHNNKLIYTTTENQFGPEYYIWCANVEHNYSFSNYFITEKESRKQKLQKLNEHNLHL
jgi:hypothetical protein